MADWTVRTNNERARELFRGTERDARQFIADHFPRAHVEPPSQDPGIPDVKLVSPDKVEDTFHADHGWASENKEDETPAEDEVPE